MKIGIRREDKSRWERRVPLIPEHVTLLKEKYNIETVVQPSSIRVFTDAEYDKAGAIVSEDLSDCSVIFGVKEIPTSKFLPLKTYVFFSHVIKGQLYNMPMLQQMMDLKCNLVDYERIVDERGRRLIFFGRHAGLAGMIDALWAYGQRLKLDTIQNPFSTIKKAYEYHSLEEIKAHFIKIGEKISSNGLPDSVLPLVVGFTGYGNVSKGAQEMLNCFPVIEISPQELLTLHTKKDISKHHIYKVVFKEIDIVKSKDKRQNFELQDYFDHPEKYESQFAHYIPYITLLMNCIYWSPKSPRLVTKADLKRFVITKEPIKLQIIGDVSCDIGGSIEITVKVTEPDVPTFVYNPLTDTIVDGIEGEGIVVVARDNLPCEIPRESSTSFSETLINFIPQILSAHLSGTLDPLELPVEIQHGLILHEGILTKDFKYIEKFLKRKDTL
ncbi:MAG TPA: hypothetical protein ENG70_04420 [Candidatus Cloacimonetes bacterium]|nr:hypothetical protein [Candidatus Cloacimonadota bacterium]HEX38087.1 hypothetical protein [Candidatus Cloacimonadota bacterium]